MDVREAIKSAKDYLAVLYEDEEVINVGLEEVRYDYDADKWHITIGFSRPWGSMRPSLRPKGGDSLERSYKEICINDSDGVVESMKVRSLDPPVTILR